MDTITSRSGVRPLAQPDVAIAQLLTGDETFATTMLAIVVDRFGPRRGSEEKLDCLTWAPATLRAELEQEFQVEIPPGNIDRLMQAIDIITGDAFWNDVRAFVNGCNVLAGSEANFTDFDPATVLECCWGVTEAIILWPDHEEDPAFPCDDVRAYVVQRLREEGYSRPPSVLTEFVQPGELNELTSDFNDPDLDLGMSKSADSRADEADDFVRGEMHKLIAQLESLPLRTGNVKELVKHLQKGLTHAPVSSR